MASVAKRTWTHKGVTGSAWVVRWRDPTGARRSTSFEQKKTADAYRLRIDNELAAGEHIPASLTLTVRQVCDLFLKSAEDRLRDGRIGRMRYNILRITLDRSIIPQIGKRKMNEVTALDLEELYRVISRKGDILPKTARDRLGTFKLVEEFAYKRPDPQACGRRGSQGTAWNRQFADPDVHGRRCLEPSQGCRGAQVRGLASHPPRNPLLREPRRLLRAALGRDPSPSGREHRRRASGDQGPAQPNPVRRAEGSENQGRHQGRACAGPRP